jgi:two-component system CheB/CheR fusion protein
MCMGNGACKILVVDDHADSAVMLARLLKSQGHEVRTAGAVAAALALCESEKFDLLISDIGLPDGSGYQLMECVRQKFGMKGIALSGRGLSEDLAASERAGFGQHLVKPIQLSDVTAAIARVAGHEKSS